MLPRIGVLAEAAEDEYPPTEKGIGGADDRPPVACLSDETLEGDRVRMADAAVAVAVLEEDPVDTNE